MKKQRQSGTHIETLTFTHFQTEIRFDKNSGIFSAKMPVEMEPESSTDLMALRRRLKEKLTEYQPQGQWVKKIFIGMSRSGPFSQPEKKFPWHTDNYGTEIGFTPEALSLGFCVFEEYVMTTPSEDGKIILRALGDTGAGRKQEPWEHPQIVWTQETEDALRSIQVAMARLGERLDEMTRDPAKLMRLAGRLLPPEREQTT